MWEPGVLPAARQSKNTGLGMGAYLFWFYTAWLTLLLPVYFIFRRFSQQANEYRWLGYALLFSFICDLIGELMFHFVKSYPNLGGNIYNLFSTIFISFFFYHAISMRLKWLMVYINVALLLFSLTNFLFIQERNLSSYSATLQSLIIILFCLLFFYKLLTDLPTTSIHHLPLFWICSGWFISSCVKLIIYSVTQYLQTEIQDNLTTIWIVHNIFTFIANIFLGIGTWLHHRQLKSI
jgi:hypothetical protein